MTAGADVAVVGAGAAGIFAALAARGALDAKGRSLAPAPGAPRVVLLDARDPVGRKILISGGGRCNVTNEAVGDRDFDTGSHHLVRGVLAGFPVASVRAFFAARGVELAAEPIGKLFPVAGGAKAVLGALFAALEEAGVERRFGVEVSAIAGAGDGWRVGDLAARRVVIATGGKSVPATGSTGFGYAFAASLGHEILDPVPALAALHGAVPVALAGVTLPTLLTVGDRSGRVLRRSAGSLLFTHRGVSGPAALDASGAVSRAIREGTAFRVLADFWTLADPGGPYAPWLGLAKAAGSCLPAAPGPAGPEAVERWLMERRRGTLGSALAERLPRRLVEAIVPAHGEPMANLPREARRAAARAATGFDLRVSGTDGFDRAEVTAGGVLLAELDRRTLESRRAPGLHFCGEVCDATGRLGGFNFQWAWSSGFAAGRGAAGANS